MTNRIKQGCCLPDAPGRCPGPENCPLMQPDAPEPREPKPGAIIHITYVEFSGSSLDCVEWTEDGGEKRSGYGNSYPDLAADNPIPQAVRDVLVKSITGGSS